jgi:hypothetical protein
MTAKGVRVGDRVRVEHASFTGHVESLHRGRAGLGGIGGNDEMIVVEDAGNRHYFDPNDSEITVTVVQPPCKAGQVWQTPDGTVWFIKRDTPRDFCAVSTGSASYSFDKQRFLDRGPKLVFPMPS